MIKPFHIILLGDSIFDNGAYVGKGPDVCTQLQTLIPHNWKATLLAEDGDKVNNIANQVKKLPGDATHLVVSAGGNNLLGLMNVLTESVKNMTDALQRMAALAEEFDREYALMLSILVERKLPTTLSTIYYPNFPDATLQRMARVALSVFNDAILRLAIGAGLPVLDLRLICNEEADYANPIEPSAHGGAKIAEAINRLLTYHDFSLGRTEVYA